MKEEVYYNELVKKTVWNAKVPIKLAIAMSDWSKGEMPLPLFYSYPKIGYLGNALPEIYQYLLKCGADVNYGDIWIEYNKIPIRLDIPFGIIADCIKPTIGNGLIHLYIRLKNYPESDLVRLTKEDSLTSNWINSFKEANIIKHPTENNNMKMDTETTKQLKKIISDNGVNHLAAFNSIMKKLEPKGINEDMKYPVKFYSDYGKICLTKPIEIKQGEQEGFTLEKYYHHIFGQEKYIKMSETCSFIIQGIDTGNAKALEMPFVFYYLNLAYLDNFLYILIKPKT